MEVTSVVDETILEFMAYQLSLSSTQLTTFYCETCHDTLRSPAEALPPSPLYEKSGLCSHCKIYDYVSNPSINLFFHKHGYLPEPKNSNLIRLNDNPKALQAHEFIWDWLIPDDYNYFRCTCLMQDENESTSWHKYKRNSSKKVYRSALPDIHKNLLMNYYDACYAPDRLDVKPDNSADSPPITIVEYDPIPPVPATIGWFASFIAGLSTFWKGRKHETSY